MVVSSKLSLKTAQHFLSFSENTCCLTDKPHTDTLACTQPSMRSGKVPGVEEMEFYAEPVIKAISRQGGQPSKHMPSTKKNSVSESRFEPRKPTLAVSVTTTMLIFAPLTIGKYPGRTSKNDVCDSNQYTFISNDYSHFRFTILQEQNFYTYTYYI